MVKTKRALPLHAENVGTTNSTNLHEAITGVLRYGVLRKDALLAEDFHHLSRRYHYRFVGEMFLVACHQIGILNHTDAAFFAAISLRAKLISSLISSIVSSGLSLAATARRNS